MQNSAQAWGGGAKTLPKLGGGGGATGVGQ